MLTTAAALVAALTFSLGQWQLNRAAQKQALMSAIEAQSNEAILKADDLAKFKNPQDAVHRRATLKGVWRAEHTVFLDNRQMNGKTGLIAVTPLVLDGTGQIILVQRGWVLRNFADRTRLPDIQTPQGPVTVRGRIRQNLDIAAFSQELALPLVAVSMLQTGPANEGLMRDWSAPNVGIDKHYGYAFQWFGLCTLIVGLYAWFQIIQPWRTRRKPASHA
jgi:surfeit locus 1 family protein